MAEYKIPVATLAIESWATNPPRPGSCGVFVDGKLCAVVELDELKRAVADLEELEATWNARNGRRL